MIIGDKLRIQTNVGRFEGELKSYTTKKLKLHYRSMVLEMNWESIKEIEVINEV